MTLNEMLAMIWLVSAIGAGIFGLSAIVNHVRKGSAKEDWKKAAIFFILSAILLYCFDATWEEETSSQEENFMHMRMHIHNK